MSSRENAQPLSSHLRNIMESRLSLVLSCYFQGYPFEVVIPQDLPIEGVILSDQIKSLDWQSRQVKFICRVPKETLDEVLSRVDLLIH